MQKLSFNVNKKANQSIRQIILMLCIIASVAILFLIVSNTMKDNLKQVKLYTSQIDNKMSEKMAFINTVAAGVESKTAQTDYPAYVDTMVEQFDDVSAVYVCIPKEGVVYADGMMTYMSGGWMPPEDFVVTERAWYQGAIEEPDKTYVSEPYIDEQSGSICITVSKAITMDGKVVGVTGLDMYMDDLVALIEGSYQGGGYVFLTSHEGTILTHPNAEIALSADKSTTVEKALKGKYQKVFKSPLKNHMIIDYKGGLKFAISNASSYTGWKIIAVISLTWVVALIILIIILGIVFALVFGAIAKKSLIRTTNPMFAPLEELAQNVSKISEGELEYSFRVDDHSQEVHALSVALNETMHDLQHYISEITSTVTLISQKNLDFEVDGEYAGDYEKIKIALVEIVTILNESFLDINEQAATVLQYSDSLAGMSESVAESATEQSSSVINASNEMKKLTENMEKITSFATAIKTNTDKTNSRLSIGNEEMKDLVVAMDEISNCYQEIAGFVGQINEIADQTNLLALNASIEAARAGEAGKGFAVVADEISSLSNSSAVSSSKIEEAIEKSLASVERGKELVQKTEQTLADSTQYSIENVSMVEEIVGFVKTQKNSAEQIAVNLNTISEIVENNAASAQENSAISTHLGECAQALMDTIAQFRLKE